MTNNTVIKRGDIYFADLNFNLHSSSIQQGIRPVIVVQNDVGNKYSPVVTIVPLTSKLKRNLPTHVMIPRQYGVNVDSVAMAEQMTTIDKSRLKDKIGSVDQMVLDKIRNAMMLQLGISEALATRQH